MTWLEAQRLNVRATRVIALLGLGALLVIAVATLIDVLGRWLFSAPIAGVYDLSTLFIAVAMAACFPAAIANRAHIKATFFADAMPSRLRLVMEAFAELVTFVFFALLAWQLVIYCVELVETAETSFILGLPVAPWWIVATVLFVLCVPVQGIVLAGAVRDAICGVATDFEEGAV